MITIHIKFFGAFRKFGAGIEIDVPANTTILAIKTELQSKLNNEKLVLDSVLANDDTVLQDSDILKDNAELSILPPVCGG